jgi:hypothetical protein
MIVEEFISDFDTRNHLIYKGFLLRIILKQNAGYRLFPALEIHAICPLLIVQTRAGFTIVLLALR